MRLNTMFQFASKQDNRNCLEQEINHEKFNICFTFLEITNINQQRTKFGTQD